MAQSRAAAPETAVRHGGDRVSLARLSLAGHARILAAAAVLAVTGPEWPLAHPRSAWASGKWLGAGPGLSL